MRKERTSPCRSATVEAAVALDSDVQAAIALAPVLERPRKTLAAVLVTLRPRQWIKNVLVVAAAGAAGALGHDDVPVRISLTCVAFCVLASGVYAINDVLDAPEDRLHPRKRRRPVAAAELSPQLAVALGVVLMSAGLTLCGLVRPSVALVGAGYVALSVSYALFWRRIVLLDIAAIAGGFVLRALAGGVAAPVALSRWFVLVVTFAAVFIAAGKRRAELVRTEATGRGRGVLGQYSDGLLRLILVGSVTLALVAYCGWAFLVPAVHGVPWRPLTLVPVAVALLRYGALVRTGHGEAPEELVFGDRVLALSGLAWLLLFALGVHALG
jgi:decaprenyl-phosphate phosphoribosyltransferase